MRLLHLAVVFGLTAFLCCPARAYVVTFDDVPTGNSPDTGVYYFNTYGIDLEFPYVEVADHTGSQWGPPHSGNNVLIVAPGSNIGTVDTMFKGQAVWSVYSFGAFFSTEQDVVLRMVAGGGGQEVSRAYIGAQGESWNNRYTEISSPAGDISVVEIYPVSADALHHFCLDDLTVVPVPEPSCLLSLLAGLAAFGALVRRRS
jgi:hypothetical protein